MRSSKEKRSNGAEGDRVHVRVQFRSYPGADADKGWSRAVAPAVGRASAGANVVAVAVAR